MQVIIQFWSKKISAYILEQLDHSAFFSALMNWGGYRTFQPQTFQPQAPTPDFSTPEFSTMNSSKSSWLNGLGLRSPGLMLGVEKSRVGMSCNLFKVSFYFGIHPWSELMREDLKKTFSFCKKPTDPKPEWHICSGTNWLASCLDCSRLRKAFRNICSKGTSLNNIRFFDRLALSWY